MMVGRFGLAIPALEFAALFGRQRNTPSSSGTLPTHSLVFGVLLTTCLIVMVVLSYLPTLALGPVLERLLSSEDRGPSTISICSTTTAAVPKISLAKRRVLAKRSAP